MVSRRSVLASKVILSRALGVMKIFLVLLAFSSAAAATDRPNLPPEVQSFIADRELCEHFREEPADGGSAEQNKRREFVRESIEIYCSGTDRRLAALKKRYAGNSVVQSHLGKYEPAIEGSCQ